MNTLGYARTNEADEFKYKSSSTDLKFKEEESSKLDSSHSLLKFSASSDLDKSKTQNYGGQSDFK